MRIKVFLAKLIISQNLKDFFTKKKLCSQLLAVVGAGAENL
jgi:hypothetical protein